MPTSTPTLFQPRHMQNGWRRSELELRGPRNELTLGFQSFRGGAFRAVLSAGSAGDDEKGLQAFGA
eukprot:9381156-Alexandrium_andersonii.AAC.1